MKLLRHPIRAIREPFGKAGLIVAMVALVAALGGSAIAAKGALTGKQKKEVEKIAKKYAGKRGAAGPAGPAGAKGDTGAAGGNGAAGDKGDPGSAGSNGVSVTSEQFNGVKEGHCPGAGGSKFTSASGNTFACNGKEGSPWTAGGTLPSGSTETGIWALNAQEKTTTIIPLSFAIPLAGNSEGVYVAGEEATCNAMSEPQLGECLAELAQKCPGISNGTPQAAEGELCVYELASVRNGTAVGTTFITPTAPLALGAGPSGALFKFECAEGTSCIRVGSWAVTAE